MRPLYKSLKQSVQGFAPWSRMHAAYSHSDATKTFPRLEELRQKLREEGREPIVRTSRIFEISRRGKDFLEDVNASHLNKKYSRGGSNGEGFVGVDEVLKLASNRYYRSDERDSLLKASDRIQDRMRVKVSKSYAEHAFNVPEIAESLNPILKVVMPDTQEIVDLEGEDDPSNQNRYSPMAGLLHKYEMLLALVSVNCSSHCRYCYRLDLFSGTSNKSKADMPVIAAYIKTFNDLIDDAIKNNGRYDKESGLWVHNKSGEPLIHAREILFSGGDPMTLPNATLARYMALMAEAGINTIRVGTKELVFNPERFDRDFWKMMDLFHQNYPEVRVELVGHYVHPYELVEAKVDKNGKYTYDVDLRYRVRKDLAAPLKSIEERADWIGHYNQFPIISGINDSPDVLRLLMRQCRRLGINLHNIYACREIRGNKHFRGENTIESQYEMVETAKGSLSGIENHARLVMSTEYGKVEVCGIDEGNILLKLNRFVHGNKSKNTIIKVDPTKLPEGQKFYWLTDEVIDTAVSGEGKKVLMELRNEGNSLIKRLKNAAAASVISQLPQNDNDPLKSSSCDQKVTIEVVNRNGGSRFIHVDLSDEKYKEKSPTLATILAADGDVEAACKEQLSCSTCVGEIESDAILSVQNEDEMDLVDSVIGNAKPSSNVSEIRAACQVSLEPSKSYKFTSLLRDADRKSGGRN